MSPDNMKKLREHLKSALHIINEELASPDTGAATPPPVIEEPATVGDDQLPNACAALTGALPEAGKPQYRSAKDKEAMAIAYDSLWAAYQANPHMQEAFGKWAHALFSNKLIKAFDEYTLPQLFGDDAEATANAMGSGAKKVQALHLIATVPELAEMVAAGMDLEFEPTAFAAPTAPTPEQQLATAPSVPTVGALAPETMVSMEQPQQPPVLGAPPQVPSAQQQAPVLEAPPQMPPAQQQDPAQAMLQQVQQQQQQVQQQVQQAPVQQPPQMPQVEAPIPMENDPMLSTQKPDFVPKVGPDQPGGTPSYPLDVPINYAAAPTGGIPNCPPLAVGESQDSYLQRIAPFMPGGQYHGYYYTFFYQA